MIGPATRLRRALFQVHLWLGLVAGTYVVVISVTGAALVFRIDLQRALHPSLFTAAAGPLADAVTIMESVSRAYPDQRLSGVDAPTTLRPTYLAYVTTPQQFTTVLVDPVTARILGELPEHSMIRTLQDLHFDLLAGRRGRLVNGVGAGALAVMVLSGIYLWWPGWKSWRRAVVIDTTRRGRRLLWDVHRVIGFWTAIFLLMWGVTGMYFAFPAAARSVIARFSPLTPARAPASAPMPGGAPPSWQAMIDRARRLRPGGHVARVVLPFGDRGAFLVMFASESPTPAASTLEPIYLDQYTGEQLPSLETSGTAGDRLVRTIAPLHVGSFGGPWVRGIWFAAGVAPVALFVTGSMVWWARIRRPGAR